LIPDEDIAASISKANLKMTLLFLMLLVIGISISYYLSKRYISPFARSIEIIKSNNFSDVSKTNIAEIDDLMEYLSANNADNIAESRKARDAEETLSAEVYEEFAKNTKNLSPAERAVFNLYVEGYTAKQIAEILCLSINTIKTHNKRIYMKLNVSSREELLVYVNMLKEAGREFE
jgi:RNA polymerase sigma factor (sigma-70 family)